MIVLSVCTATMSSQCREVGNLFQAYIVGVIQTQKPCYVDSNEKCIFAHLLCSEEQKLLSWNDTEPSTNMQVVECAIKLYPPTVTK